MLQSHSRRRVFSVSLCLGLLLPFGRSQAILDLKYVKPLHCPNMALSTQLRYQTRAVRSLLQCLTACRASATCVSVVHERASDLCHLGSSPAMQNCSNMEPTGPDVNFYEQKVGVSVHFVDPIMACFSLEVSCTLMAFSLSGGLMC